MKRIVIGILLLAGILPVHAQLLKNLKKLAEDKAKEITSEENLKKVGKDYMNSLDKARARFDSTDFDYAILLSDNSGLFDVQEKGEITAKISTLWTLGSASLNKDELSDEERARLNLERGELAYASGWFNSADTRLSLAKKNYEDAKLTDDIGYLKAIADQGLLYATMGRFTQAEAATVEALKMRREKLDENNVGVASSLNNYAVIHYDLGRYNEAEHGFGQSMRILESNHAQEALPYAIVMNNQAMLFQTVGRYEEAEKTLKQAISIAEKLQSSKSRNHLKFLSNLALLYQQMGKYNEAETIYLGMDKRLNHSDADYASMLNNLAALYMKMNKEDKVEDLLKKSVSIYKSSLGEESPAYATATNDLGNFYRYKERYAEAEPLLQKALTIREKTLGVNHPHYVQSREDMAILYWKKKQWDTAYATYRDVMDKSVDFINRYFPPMSEAEKTKYWDVLSPRFQRFNNFAIEASAQNPQLLEDLYDYQLATKALLLNSTNKIKHLILSSGNKELIKDYVSWLDQKEKLARLYAYSKEELEKQEIDLDSLERAANNMERKLSERSAEFSAGYATQKINYKQIQKLLNDTEALVDIIRVKNFDRAFTEDVKYIALVLTKNAALPKLIALDNGSQLETRYAKYYRNAIQQKIPDEYSYDQYWSKLEGELAGKKLIYFSPDGVYNQINLNTLRRSGGDYFINRFDLVILGNSKDLVDIKKRKALVAKKTATLVGFPDYGSNDIASLPGTKIELDGISKVLKASAYKVQMFTQKTATEATIKSTKAVDVLHIATHGYFLQDVPHSGGSVFGINTENASNNPLLRSGLLLAGAGKTEAGAMPNLQSNDNGVLTAYEAMNLNLEGTSLVVLSACETGLGDVKAGEGVYGLQRAFLVAGADALVMSLWRVDDAATQLLMTSFYSNWLKLRNKQKAFKQAQLQLMAKYKEPYYWGAFVMMGM